MSRTSRRFLAVAAVIALTAGCSGTPSAGGSGGSSTPAGSASSSPAAGGSSAVRPATLQQKMNAYSACMRSHGVPLPNLPANPGKPSGKPTAKPVTAVGPNPGSPRWQAAQHACQSLLPPSTKGGPGPAGLAGG